MVILEVNKVKEGLIRVITDEKQIMLQADRDIKAFGESCVLLECGDVYSLIDIDSQTCETLECYQSSFIDTENYFGQRGGMTVESEEDKEYANHIINFMKKEFDNNDDINNINQLKSHLFKLCVSRHIDLDALMQILSLCDYDDERIWNQNFYIAFSLAELLIKPSF